MERLLFALILLSSLLSATTEFVCPANFPCYCMRSEDTDSTHKLHCVTSEISGSAFDLTVQSSDFVRIQCINSPDWSDFLLGANLRIGSVTNFHYVGCQLPCVEYSQSVVTQLGIYGVEYLKIDKLRGNISKADLDVFPWLKNLVLAGNRLGDVPMDLLYGLPRLAKLDLRSTRVKLPSRSFFKNSRSLVSLELSQNDLHDLQPGVFDGLDKIELLNMWSSNVNSFHPRVFRSLSTLVSLDIKNNRLRTLPHDIFHDLTSLKVIDLGVNNFTEFPADLFSRNRRLKTIKLSRNRANVTRLPDRFLAGLTNLTVLSLERLGLYDVPENLIRGSDAIVEFNANRNYLTTLPADLLKDARRLHKLNLSFNELRVLPDRVFAGLKRLVELDLSRNRLSVVNEYLFHGLDALQELNMEHNGLKFIEADALVSLRSLRVAKFSYNQLNLRTNIIGFFGHVSPFDECKSLEELHLSHNNISEMFADWTVGHIRLRKLDLSYNSLDYLQTEDLQFVSDKVQVNLTHNEISSIDLSRLEFISAQQMSSRNVRIDLNSNPIQCDCDLYSLLRYTNEEMSQQALAFITLLMDQLVCDGPDKMKNSRLLSLKTADYNCALEDDSSDPCAPDGMCECWLRPSDRTLILDCTARNLTEAPTNIISGNADRVEVDLSGNSLRMAPSLMDNGYEKVRSLDLSGNQIEFINHSLISPDLEVLYLNGNQLSFIDSEILEKIASNSSIRSLTLHDNPWRCDCQALALLDFVQNGHELVSNRSVISCASTNWTLSSLRPIDLCPYPIPLIVIVCSIVAFLGLLVGAVVALFFFYNQEIKIYLYSKNLCLWFITQEELDRDKTYDAFVSYSHRDHDFVIEQLVKKLEDGPKPYKLCIHVRDWLAGDWIPTQILRSVQESRRTVIVLSPHFIESEWGKMEFQAAHKKAISDKCARVIIILYGDIDPASVEDPDLRDYLKMNTYIKWGDPWFYQKLRYALPHNKYRIPKTVNSNIVDDWYVTRCREEIVQGKIV